MGDFTKCPKCGRFPCDDELKEMEEGCLLCQLAAAARAEEAELHVKQSEAFNDEAERGQKEAELALHNLIAERDQMQAERDEARGRANDQDNANTILVREAGKLKAERDEALEAHGELLLTVAGLTLKADKYDVEKERADRNVEEANRFHQTAVELGKQLATLRAANEKVGGWLSAALEDPKVCESMKRDAREWFDVLAQADAGEGE